jgi:hypothetical protein
MNIDAANHTRTGSHQPHIVIAHNYVDHEFARRLTAALRREGFTPWIDDIDLSAGVILINRIAHAVRPVDFLIPVISSASVGLRWVQHDLKTVATRGIGARRVRVLPARIDDTALPGFLKSQSYIDFYSHGWERAFNDLRTVVLPHAAGLAAHAMPPPQSQRPIPRAQPVLGKKVPSGTRVVFVSYDHENDGYYKDVLLTWANDPDFPRLLVSDQPVTAPIESEEAAPAKRTTLGRIKAATGFLCVVGLKTCSSRWVEWETRTAIDLEKRMIAVRINRDCAFPEVLSDVGATCALSFTFEGIKQAVNEAYGVIAAE